MSRPTPRPAGTWRIVAVVEMETNDPRLSPDRINHAPRSAEETATTRQAVLDNLLRTKRVILVTGPEMMEGLLETHELAAQIAGVHAQMFSRPAADYEAPDDAEHGTHRRRRP
jgi:hypothetical protein